VAVVRHWLSSRKYPLLILQQALYLEMPATNGKSPNSAYRSRGSPHREHHLNYRPYRLGTSSPSQNFVFHLDGYTRWHYRRDFIAMGVAFRVLVLMACTGHSIKGIDMRGTLNNRIRRRILRARLVLKMSVGH